MTPPPAPKVHPGQLWKNRDGQYFRVVKIAGGVATVRLSSPDGRSLKAQIDTVLVEGMRTGWQIVSE